MLTPWKTLHTSLTRSVRTLRADLALLELKALRPVLARFHDGPAVVDYLTCPGGDLDDKDHILAALIASVQRREHHEVASALLWLGLWPALTAIYRRQLRWPDVRPDELVSEVGERFAVRIERLDLDAVHRVAATLARNTERAVMIRRKRVWADMARRRYMTGDDRFSTSSPCVRPVLTFAPLCVWHEPGLVLTRSWLQPLVGQDTDLLLGVVVFGHSHDEVGRALGLSKAAIAQRSSRAIKRIRHHLRSSLSHRDLIERV